MDLYAWLAPAIAALSSSEERTRNRYRCPNSVLSADAALNFLGYKMSTDRVRGALSPTKEVTQKVTRPSKRLKRKDPVQRKNPAVAGFELEPTSRFELLTC